MKYTYKNKKTYKVKNKLKILLTILFAALISTTGYILSKNVFSKLDYEYFNEITQDGINIKVVGERGVIPDDSTLKIEKVSKEEKENVDASINAVKNNNMNTVESYTYDIKILDSNNNEIEPSDEIKILFTNDLINNKNLNTNIYHTSAENNNLTTEVLKGEVEGETITTKTDSFSYYTVEFTYNNLTYSIEGDSEVKLSTILEQVGLEGEVESVIGSNDNLFSFEKRNNEWYVKTNKAFSTTEWMKVTIDGIEYEITVTDAINYTITYQSGNDGYFEGGSTTNVVNYSISDPQSITKYSHTPNVSDTGVKKSNYASNLNTNDVVTIPGASTLTVDIYYNGQSVSYDWLSVWAGNYPSYTASSNRTSTGYVTTEMGAPNNNNKFGGSQTGSYTVNGNSLTNMGHCTLTIDGDSVTFGFKSDGSGYGKGYGYYAIVSGMGTIKSITSGTYKEPLANDPEYCFKEWSINPDTITTDTIVTASYEEYLLNQNSKGTYDGVDWKIKGDGTLIIGKAGEVQSYLDEMPKSYSEWPWYQYGSQITEIEFAGQVNGNGSHVGMFYGCNATAITNINNFNTSGITNMVSMFCQCSNLMTLDLTNFDTSNVTNMSYIFCQCRGLTSLDLTSFDTSNVTDMYQMFYNCSSLTSLDLTSFDTSNVTNMSFMFRGCSDLTSLYLTSFDTLNVTNMSYIFCQCRGLTSLDLTSFDTSNVTDMYQMFYNCSSLTSLDLTSFDTSNVTDMYQMFYNCSSLTSLDLTSFDTSNVTSMNSIFYKCSSLTSLDLTSFDTSNITNISSMFYQCSSLTSLDLTSFDTSNVTNMRFMFRGCSGLTSLDLTSFDTSNVTNMSSMFYQCSSLTSLDLTSFDTPNVTSMNSMFYQCSSLTSLDLTSFNTSKVIDMAVMFSSCSNLITIYVSHGWNAGGVTSSTSMFMNCTNIVGEQGTIFDSSVIDNTYAKIDGGISDPGYLSYRSHNFETMAYAVFDSSDGSFIFFKDDATKWYDKQVDGTKTYYTNIENTVGGISWSDKKSLIQSVSFEDVISPIELDFWFYGFSNSNLVFDFTNLDTSKVTSMNSVFSNCSGAKTLDLSNFDTSKVKYMQYMFRGCSGLTSLDLTSFDTSNVTDMQYMFRGCRSLKTLDLTSFDTSNVTDMQYMFSECGITSPDLSSFDTSNVTNMDSMFYNSYSMQTLDLSSFDTSNVTNMCMMFYGCEYLTTLDLTGWNTSSVTNMSYIFDICRRLVSLDLSSFDTSNITSMECMFVGCDTLTILNLSNFNTSNVKYMNSMFSSCDNLVTIYVSDAWNTDAVITSSNMFYECTKIVGGQGTTFDSSAPIDKTRAKIDGGVSDPGYLTLWTDNVKLTIVEEVRGSIADINKNFAFTLNILNGGAGISGDYNYTGTRSGTLTFLNGETTFYLKHGENLQIELPGECDYTITQHNDSDGYTLSKTNDTGTLNSDITSTFINTLNGTTPTGILIDLIPFIILITCGILGIFLIRKHKYI